jgi:hypothetical protein
MSRQTSFPRCTPAVRVYPYAFSPLPQFPPVKSVFICFFLWLILTSTLAAAPAPTFLVNGSFEDPPVSTNYNFTGSFSFTGWTGFSTGSGNGGGNAGIVPGVSFGLSPTDGNQAFTFNGDNPPSGTWIEQTFATSPGRLYFLDFDVGRNNGFPDQTLRLQVQLFNSSSIQIGFGQFTPPPTVGYASDQLAFVADSTTTRLRFTDISGSNPNTDLFLDNVAIAQIPEPSVGVLSIVLVASLGLLRRKDAVKIL